MRALRLTAWGAPPAMVDVEPPVPGEHGVVLRVAAAGICHSDLHVLKSEFSWQVPFTLGHEVAGTVAEIGSAVTDVDVGDRVVVHGPWGCGTCGRCLLGQDNYCDRRHELAWSGMGLGLDGGMADQVLVPARRHLVPIGDLDATQAAPLSDAGLTPYHAIMRVADRLDEHAAACVIGIGGLGHLAIQILRAVTSCRVFAVDVREDALDLARRVGAHVTTAVRPDTAQVLRARNGGVGMDAAFDFVGAASTMALGAAGLRADGDLVVVGSGGGELTVGKGGSVPQGTRISVPFWGTRPELGEIIALARKGSLRVETSRFPLSEAIDAIDRLRTGRVLGRAVLVPS